MQYINLSGCKLSIDILWHIFMIIYKKTDEWYIEWQRMTINDNEWYNEWQLITTSATTSENEWYNEWQRVTTGDNEWYKSDKEWFNELYNEWQQMATGNSERQQWYNEWKQHSTLQRMDDCHPFKDKNRYTTTSRDGWVQLEWLNKWLSLRYSKKVVNK